MTETLVAIPETCERLGGISHWTLRMWINAGRIASVKLGARVLIPESEIARLIAEGLRPRSRDREARPAALPASRSN